MRESEEFQQVRWQGKDARRLLTDQIQKFVDYAAGQGSNSADRYFGIISALSYRSFLVAEPKSQQGERAFNAGTVIDITGGRAYGV